MLIYRSSHSEVFLGKGILKICSKFTGELPCRSVLCNFIEIALRHGCSLINLLHVFRTPFPKNTPGELLLNLSILTTARRNVCRKEYLKKQVSEASLELSPMAKMELFENIVKGWRPLTILTKSSILDDWLGS